MGSRGFAGGTRSDQALVQARPARKCWRGPALDAGVGGATGTTNHQAPPSTTPGGCPTGLHAPIHFLRVAPRRAPVASLSPHALALLHLFSTCFSTARSCREEYRDMAPAVASEASSRSDWVCSFCQRRYSKREHLDVRCQPCYRTAPDFPQVAAEKT